MKAKVLIIALLAVMAVGVQNASAQKVRKVRAIEVEIGGGIVTPTDKLKFDENKLGWNAQVELRYNFKHLPLDLGLHVDGALLGREGDIQNSSLESIEDIKTVHFASMTGLAVVDFNLRRAKNFSIFVGCGVGYGMLINDIEKISEIGDIDKLGCFCVMPRVGVELFHHLRATLYYKNLKTEQSHFGVNLGIVFGGGKKKVK